jgi:hypothetical protein
MDRPWWLWVFGAGIFLQWVSSLRSNEQLKKRVR